MPTPIEILMDPVSLVVIAMYFGFIVLETLAPGRNLPSVRAWPVYGFASFMIFFYLSSYLPLVWDQYLAPFQVMDLSFTGVLGGTIIGLLVYEFAVYVWHRTMHKSDVLWRVFHQMHHSAERLDTHGAFYFSPFDMVGWTLLGSLSLVLLVGVAPQAATNILLITTFLAIFQHSNIRTPRWLGYIIQRPESHTIHHGRHIHQYNYSDLPVFDMVFGTFKNPRSFEVETGFELGDSKRVIEMLAFKDIYTPSEQPQSHQTNDLIINS